MSQRAATTSNSSATAMRSDHVVSRWRAKQAVSVLLFTILTAATYMAWAYYLADRSTGPMLLAARRGDIANWPENTIEGVSAAASLGAEAIEFDIRRSADGIFFLMHDETVDRTTNGAGLILEMSAAEVEALEVDGGLGYDGESNLRVPRLEDVLRALSSYEGLLLLDTKGSASEHRAVANLVQDRELNAIVSVQNADDNAAVKAVGPIVTYGRHGSGADYEGDDSPLPLSAWFTRPHNSAILETWTGDESGAMDLAYRWGVKIYITNDIHAAMDWSAANSP
jgi:hypothetical protein